jgi:hypothetical protein
VDIVDSFTSDSSVNTDVVVQDSFTSDSSINTDVAFDDFTAIDDSAFFIDNEVEIETELTVEDDSF